MTMRRVCVVTGTRAEYGLFFPIMKRIQASSHLKLQVVATTMHLSREFGSTYRQIEEDGFFIDEKVENLLSLDTKESVAKSTGLAVILLSDALSRLRPDLLLILGDRFETHAAATTAMLMNIPIAHIHGGEITEGAVDEKIRHSITKMSTIHFTSTEKYRNRVIQMGELPDTVFNVGAPGIDNIINLDLLDKEAFEREVGWRVKRPAALFTYHSETLSNIDSEVQIRKILSEIKRSKINVIFTYANSDYGGRVINEEIERFAAKDRDKYLVVRSLGQLKYLSAMKHLDLIIGNSSSGIIESASFKKPVINIGDRQLGRMQNPNTINCTVKNLGPSIEKALSKDFYNEFCYKGNVYGSGNTAEKIVDILESERVEVVKKFYDL